ncbi:low molecular weight phosphatase family protein [Roseibium aggregatum]|uniref:arsenate-mycothiol transferase ArsC n=1 Tax=Roseibium aggregatum TaxID=187304 RepID=UPI001AD932AA|nr:hypothetical protein [Roseibium aggregatum]
MSKTTVLFVCPDNAFLSPLAEAYMNARGEGIVRAFSAGLVPAPELHAAARRLLSAHGLQADGLTPKSLDVFLQPLAPALDRIIYLADLPKGDLSAIRGDAPAIDVWRIADALPRPESFETCAAMFDCICDAIDDVLDPPVHPEAVYRVLAG